MHRTAHNIAVSHRTDAYRGTFLKATLRQPDYSAGGALVLDWLKHKSRQMSEGHIRVGTAKLIAIANRVDRHLEATGYHDPQLVEMLRKQRRSLALDLCGPLSIEEVRTNIFEPALAGPDVTQGARETIEHLYNTFRSA